MGVGFVRALHAQQQAWELYEPMGLQWGIDPHPFPVRGVERERSTLPETTSVRSPAQAVQAVVFCRDIVDIALMEGESAPEGEDLP